MEAAFSKQNWMQFMENSECFDRKASHSKNKFVVSFSDGFTLISSDDWDTVVSGLGDYESGPEDSWIDVYWKEITRI
jgi:hypothetical protein